MISSVENEIKILFLDDHYVAIHKPSGLLVHPEKSVPGVPTCLHLLKSKLNRYVFPVHRLDRATSGVLFMALHEEAARLAGIALQKGEIQKKYLAIVRGWMSEEGRIEHPIRDYETKKEKPAVTDFRLLAKTEFKESVGRYPTARYSLVRFRPQTGRTHQIRRHAAHLFHPIIGDTIYGDGRHNRFFREKFGWHRLLLHAEELRWRHPMNGNEIVWRSPVDERWSEVIPLPPVSHTP